MKFKMAAVVVDYCIFLIRERVCEHDEASYRGKMATIVIVSRARKDKNCEHTF